MQTVKERANMKSKLSKDISDKGMVEISLPVLVEHDAGVWMIDTEGVGVCVAGKNLGKGEDLDYTICPLYEGTVTLSN